MAHRVSVIVPVHNGEKTVERAVRSALDQTYRDIEVVAVDDGSTDRSWEILQQLAEADDRVVTARREFASGGPAVPRNVALGLATGSFFALLDQDDYWMPRKLAAQMPLFDDSAIGVVYSDARTTDSESYLRRLRHLGSPPSGEVLAQILRWNFVPTCTAVWRREVNEQLGGFVEELSTVDDRDYWIRAARAGIHFGYVAEALAVYTTTGDRLSDDSARHGRLVVRMWERHSREWPDDPFVVETLRRSRRFVSHILAKEAAVNRGSRRICLLWESLRMCPEPRNIAKILSGRLWRDSVAPEGKGETE